MNEKEIIEGNSLIRVFENPLMTIIDGWVCASDDNARLFPVASLKYHYNWNDLMPVVEKIESIKYKEQDDIGDIANYPYLRTFHKNTDSNLQMVRINRMGLYQAETRIEATWLAVIDFIKWYNQNNFPSPPKSE